MSPENTVDDLGMFEATPEAPAATPSQPEAPAATTPPAPAAAQPVPGATPASGTPPAASPEAPVQPVPLATFLDMRDRAKRAEDKLKKFETEGNEFVPPDPVKNPAEWAQYNQDVTNFSILNERLNFSEKWAIKEHTKEKVDKVREWTMARMETDDAFAAKVMGDPDPYGFAIQAYDQEELLKEMTPDTLAKFREWQKAQANGGGSTPPAGGGSTPQPNRPAQPAAPAAKPQPAAAPLPRSIADQPSAGGVHGTPPPMGADAAFSGVFPG